MQISAICRALTPSRSSAQHNKLIKSHPIKMQISISGGVTIKKGPMHAYPQYEFITRRGVRIRLSHLCIHFHSICMQRVEFKYNENVHTQTSRLISLSSASQNLCSAFSSTANGTARMHIGEPGALNTNIGWEQIQQDENLALPFSRTMFYWETWV